MEHKQKVPIFKISLISILSVILFLFLILVVLNPRIEINGLVLRSGRAADNPVNRLGKKEIESYNDANWNEYVQEWNLAKESASILVHCNNTLENIHKSLEERHKDYLRLTINGDTASEEKSFYEGIYMGTGELISKISDYSSINVQSEPYFYSTMFVNIDDPNSTKEAATNRLKEEIDGYKRIQVLAGSLSCVFPETINYEQKDSVCETIINLNHGIKDVMEPIVRDSFEIDEQYDLALKRRQEEKENNLKSCKQGGVGYTDIHY